MPLAAPSDDPYAPVAVVRTRKPAVAREYGLVLAAVGIECELLEDPEGLVLAVEPAQARQAATELELYAEENRGWRRPEELPLAMIDARAVELAIINLLDNAFKYAKDGGRVDVAFERQGEFVLVRVRDQGPGIEPDEQERIFERFVRGRRAGENRVRGSGIGLALVKHIAESHGGTISVTSPITEDRRGSMFVLKIPILRGEAQRAAMRAALAEGKAPDVA